MINKTKNQKFRDLLTRAVENVVNGVVISDAQKKDNPITYVNKAFTDITGYSKEEVLGKNCRFLQGENTNQSELKKLRAAIKNKKEIYVILKNVKKDGTLFWNELHITPVFDENNNLTNFIGIQNDITQRKNAQDELIKYKEYLQKTVDQRTIELIESNNQLRREVQERQKAQEKISLLYSNIYDSAKKLQTKLNKVEEEKISLTKKERKAFLGLVMHPHSTLQKLSKKINLPISTINAVKTRLHKEGYFDKMNLPRFELFTKYLLSIVYFDGLIQIDKKYSKGELEKMFDPISNVIYVKFSNTSGFYVTLTKNWSEFKKLNDLISKKLQINKDIFKIINTVHFDLENSKVQKLFDYDTYIRRTLEVETIPKKTKCFKKISGKLNEAQKKVFYGLVKYPKYTSKKLSQRIEVSEPTISKYKNDLEKTGLIKIINKPVYNKLGISLLVLRHYHFAASESNDLNESSKNDFLSFTTSTDHVSFGIYKNYADVKEDDAYTIINERSLIGDSFKLIIPLVDIKYIKQDFSAILRKILYDEVGGTK